MFKYLMRSKNTNVCVKKSYIMSGTTQIVECIHIYTKTIHPSYGYKGKKIHIKVKKKKHLIYEMRTENRMNKKMKAKGEDNIILSPFNRKQSILCVSTPDFLSFPRHSIHLLNR